MSVSFIGSLSQVTRGGRPSKLCDEENNCVLVYPSHGRYIDQTSDWDHMLATTSVSVQEAPAPDTQWLESALPLTELQWRAGYHQALLNPWPTEAYGDLLQLSCWPNLTRLPAELVIPVTRICALLWRKPTVGYLIPRILETSPHQVNALLQLLRNLNHVQTRGVSVSGFQPLESEALHEEPASPSVKTKTPSKPSLVGKLWQRLTGR